MNKYIITVVARKKVTFVVEEKDTPDAAQRAVKMINEGLTPISQNGGYDTVDIVTVKKVDEQN